MINPEYLFNIARASLVNFLLKEGLIHTAIDSDVFLLTEVHKLETVFIGPITNVKVYYGKGKKHYYTVSTSAVKINGSTLRHKAAYLTFASGHLIKVSYGNL